MFSEKKSIKLLKERVGELPELVLVLGSGWKRAIEKMEVEKEVVFSQWLGVETSVPGHEGKLVVGSLGSKKIGVMSGRVHMYEGFSGEEATMWVRVLTELGMRRMVLTAACGALNKKYRVGDFVLTNDLLTLFLALDNPLKGPKFLDMSKVFDVEMRIKCKEVMKEMSLPMQEGVYAYYHGPNFETPADKKALMGLGADVVGMSTVPETIQARWLGVKVLSLAFVTNLAFVKHDHKEVLEAAERSADKMAMLIEETVKGF